MLKILERLAWLFALAAGLTACVVAVATVVSVVGRAFFDAPIQGDVEITQFGIALCLSLCLPWCQVHGGNIIVDFFTQSLGDRTRSRLDGIGALLIAVMAFLLAWRSAVGAESVMASFESSMLLGLPTWWTYAMVAPGLALTGLVALVQAGYRFAGRDPVEAVR